MNYTQTELCQRIIDTMDSDQLIDILEIPIDILVWNIEEYIGDNMGKFEGLFDGD